MSYKIKFNKSEFSEKELQNFKVFVSGEDAYVSFFGPNCFLPIRTSNGNKFVKWGNKSCLGVRAPLGAFCKIESLKSGYVAQLRPKVVEVIANAAQENGIWFQVKQGIRAVLIKDRLGNEFAYILTVPSTHYYKTMTRAERMPVLVGQVI